MAKKRKKKGKNLHRVCFFSERCDGKVDCSDASDEINCPCAEDEFTCACYKLNPPRCLGENRCISLDKYHDNESDCPDGSDETQFVRKVRCDLCNVTIFRLNDILECSLIGLPLCDNSTCYETRALSCADSKNCDDTEVICTSFCPLDTMNRCNAGFQCADGTLALSSQFCDGNIDCPDNSDELTKQPGFTCLEQAKNCVLPQRNLFDDIAHCQDKSDICTSSNITTCFQCYDRRLNVSTNQLCDGVRDCYDYSDECLCEYSFELPFCKSLSSIDSLSNQCGAISKIVDTLSSEAPIQNDNVITCRAKWGMVSATLCDGRPECADFRDECNSCFNPPEFCLDPCNSNYQLGDRYCDGIEDEAWKIINRPECPKGFDERNCPKRFKCKAGHRVSIEESRVCDGKKHCDDGSDEQNCGPARQTANERFVSSQGEMIQAPGLKYVIWIMAFVVIVGNLYVIMTSFKRMRKEKIQQSVRFQYFIFLNIGVADLVMGWYLLGIAIQSAMSGDSYSETEDYKWRTSIACSVVGSFVLISSEAACFLMVLLLGFILYISLRPPVDDNSKCMKRLLVVGTFTAWIAAILLAILPILNGISDHFVQNIFMVSPFSQKSVWDFDSAKDFSCRLASLTEKIVEPNDWNTINSFLTDDFPEAPVLGNFGYYSATSLCMPRLFVTYGERSWQYTFVIVTANFISYLFISLSYLAASKLALREQTEDEEPFKEQDEKMQKRVARVVFTNVAAWLVISIMVYIGISGVFMSYSAHLVTTMVLLPINSILNPILFSALLEKPKSVCCL